MGSSIQLKEVFEVESKHTAFFTGGNIEWYDDKFYCQTSSSINLLNTKDGNVSLFIGEELSEDSDLIQTFTTDGSRTITSHKSGLLKLWNQNGELEKMWKYIHRGPIATLQIKENRLASGGADSAVRIWDLDYQSCILNLKGCQGVVSVVKYHPTEEEIFATGDDGKILHWDLETGELKKIYERHFSKVTSIVFTHDKTHFISSGRDKVMILWKFMEDTPLKTIPFYESIECIVSLPEKFKVPHFKADPECYYIASGGEKGVVRVWDVTNVREVYVQDNSLVTSAKEGGIAISRLLLHPESKTLAVVTVEQNIVLHHLKSFACTKQFIGFIDEILDIALMGVDDSHIAVATNSCDIKVYENSTMNCEILKGHTDIVLSLSVSKTNPNLLLSSSKDNSIRLWLRTYNVVCVAVGKRHTGSIGSCFFSQTSERWAVTVSADSSLKKWDLPTKYEGIVSLSCSTTETSHEKDINCITVSPNDKIIGTASQDKTARLWNENLKLIGVLRGHKRSVWSIRFSPVDQVAITSSADCTIRLWNINDLGCLKTLEGHESSVLRAEFISNGLQILSSGADGLIKLFSIKTSECQLTLDEHDGKIWALAIKKDESGIVTGGSDSNLIKWRDITEEKKLEKIKEEEEQVLQEQKLNNYLKSGKYLKALKFALRLGKVFQVLNIIKEIIKTEEQGLADTIKSLRDDQKDDLLKCAVNWNTNSKNCQAAQLVINILLNEIQGGEFKPSNFPSTIESILPYTERHFKRLTHLIKELHFISYTMNCMKPVNFRSQ
ncbi:hypothetical protein WA026_010957 [Henosepilachna vigintioctopunctata]|uniref:U3 small nucleolar RNA-associated protein 13 C-terminal domain-containing protein n=1 Tax=Henosepilachna vigintioctopunctata TaxID=420089 RepID=A0AAW1UPN8_9CUCU